ncbi:hypothetical protein [Ramlibacter alkalitolerans]|uniref:Uncharacterized protein n=1 Tax=Ramlibacter alkalitolerans TaxID=2039631 RepID=A0ABS1JUN1_9BURK|nr:hypothetical protein [Ramlibacter alkalitolerans]MBL0427866.1 hypothetical protein [Ramlibacter alkalitolerans]
MDELTYLQDAIEAGAGRQLRDAGMSVETACTAAYPAQLSIRIGSPHKDCPVTLRRLYTQHGPSAAFIREWWEFQDPRKPEDHPQNVFLRRIAAIEHNIGRLNDFIGLLQDLEPSYQCGTYSVPDTFGPEEEHRLFQLPSAKNFPDLAGDKLQQAVVLARLTEREPIHRQLASVDWSEWRLAFGGFRVTGEHEDAVFHLKFLPVGKTSPELSLDLTAEGGVRTVTASATRPTLVMCPTMPAGPLTLAEALEHSVEQVKRNQAFIRADRKLAREAER